jgi:hypothetical protein
VPPPILWLLPAALVANAALLAWVAYRVRGADLGPSARRWLVVLIVAHLAVATVIAAVLAFA